MSADKDARIAELVRKLAEQQAYNLRLCVVIDACHIALVDGDISTTKAAIATINNPYPAYSTEELSTLLAKAKEDGRREAVPEGWQVVPKEHTWEMLDAFNGPQYCEIMERLFAKGYKAMLAAAPKPEQPK